MTILLFIFLQGLFWLSLLGIIHSYVCYPFILQLLSKNKTLKPIKKFTKDNLPFVYIIVVAFNEETVIEKKLLTVLDTEYPRQLLKIIVGSDGSTDQTHAIVNRLAAINPEIELIVFEGRRGKPAILNELHHKIQTENTETNYLYMLSDANVYFDKNTIPVLVHTMNDPEIGMAGAQVKNIYYQKAGISEVEQLYISRENRIKYQEGVLWGTMMGAFGACFIMRPELFEPIPKGSRVDDFYLTMKVLEIGTNAIMQSNAKCYEDLPEDMAEEFKRKRRMSGGNFQNLARFKHFLWSRRKGLAFSFLSHKVLRWISPFLFAIALLSSLLLFTKGVFIFGIAFIVLILLGIAPLLLRKNRFVLNGKIPFLKSLVYFDYMNLAIVLGFWDYLKGIESNVWEPTKRTIENV